MKSEDVVFIPNELVNNLSAEALGAVCWMIANKEMKRISFDDLIRNNRGSSVKKLLRIIEELVAKDIASEADGLWSIEISQPEGRIQILISQD